MSFQLLYFSESATLYKLNLVHGDSTLQRHHVLWWVRFFTGICWFSTVEVSLPLLCAANMLSVWHIELHLDVKWVVLTRDQRRETIMPTSIYVHRPPSTEWMVTFVRKHEWTPWFPRPIHLLRQPAPPAVSMVGFSLVNGTHLHGFPNSNWWGLGLVDTATAAAWLSPSNSSTKHKPVRFGGVSRNFWWMDVCRFTRNCSVDLKFSCGVGTQSKLFPDS